MPKSFHAKDEKLGVDGISLSNTFGREEPIQKFPFNNTNIRTISIQYQVPILRVRQPYFFREYPI